MKKVILCIIAALVVSTGAAQGIISISWMTNYPTAKLTVDNNYNLNVNGLPLNLSRQQLPMYGLLNVVLNTTNEVMTNYGGVYNAASLTNWLYTNASNGVLWSPPLLAGQTIAAFYLSTNFNNPEMTIAYAANTPLGTYYSTRIGDVSFAVVSSASPAISSITFSNGNGLVEYSPKADNSVNADITFIGGGNTNALTPDQLAKLEASASTNDLTAASNSLAAQIQSTTNEFTDLVYTNPDVIVYTNQLSELTNGLMSEASFLDWSNAALVNSLQAEAGITAGTSLSVNQANGAVYAQNYYGYLGATNANFFGNALTASRATNSPFGLLGTASTNNTSDFDTNGAAYAAATNRANILTALPDLLTNSGNGSSLTDLIPTIWIEHYGAKADGKRLLDAAFTNGTSILFSPSAPFSSSDVGKVVTVYLDSTNSIWTNSTIVSFNNAQSVTLGLTFPETKMNATVWFGTDNTAAFQAAFNDMTNRLNDTLGLHNGVYIIAGTPYWDGHGYSVTHLPVVQSPYTNNIGSPILNLIGSEPNPAMIKHADYNAPIAGSVIYCPSLSVSNGTDAVIGFNSTTEGSTFNQSRFFINGVEFLYPLNPKISIINAEYGGGLVIKDSSFMWDAPYYMMDYSPTNLFQWSLLDGNDTTLPAAVVFPTQNNAALSQIQDSWITGYPVGVAVSEHSKLYNDKIFYCGIGIQARNRSGAYYVEDVALDNTILSSAIDIACPTSVPNGLMVSGQGVGLSFATLDGALNYTNVFFGNIVGHITYNSTAPSDPTASYNFPSTGAAISSLTLFNDSMGGFNQLSIYSPEPSLYFNYIVPNYPSAGEYYAAVGGTIQMGGGNFAFSAFNSITNFVFAASGHGALATLNFNNGLTVSSNIVTKGMFAGSGSGITNVPANSITTNGGQIGYVLTVTNNSPAWLPMAASGGGAATNVTLIAGDNSIEITTNSTSSWTLSVPVQTFLTNNDTRNLSFYGGSFDIEGEAILGETTIIDADGISVNPGNIIVNSGSFIGDGSGITNVPANSITTNGGQVGYVLTVTNNSPVWLPPASSINYSNLLVSTMTMAFDGSTHVFELEHTNSIDFTNWSGTSGSMTFYLTNQPVTYTEDTNVLIWGNGIKPITVTNGLISFERIGTHNFGAYLEFQ